MKIRFDLPPTSSQESNGMAVRYAAAKRQVPRWRWYLLLALVIMPPLYLALRFVIAYWWEPAPAFVTLQDVVVKAGVSGRIAQIQQPGVRLNAGDPVGKLQTLPVEAIPEIPDNPQPSQVSPAQLDVARASLALAERQLQLRNQHLEAVRRLLAAGAATAAELANAQAMWSGAEADRIRAARDLADLRGASSRRVSNLPKPIKPLPPVQPPLGVAPVSGELLRLLVRPGEWVTEETEVALLRGTAEPRIMAYIQPAEARYAKLGRAATLRFADGGQLPAHVVAIAPETQRLPADRTAQLMPRGQAIVVTLQPDQPLPLRYRIHQLPLDVRFDQIWPWQQ
ncbi:HlyD family efflux transporter periplasmic adaptor subunit [Parachitinimonas caeni]|uniref:HlyD family efflux transporter periplasmic adaptor subunit n=1 Tax=Parachitinimonas caeni TaxID=3031301 RepID=A0ABT7DXN6_9NEIS|nr:HlyD family efflux transporter periplasmic adaptor subunit [Parachitinimonas caeni]MDK2124754.1 HlyD family efflux transporter periplasmic adaptor subunit [Parachitinimonas caeni]